MITTLQGFGHFTKGLNNQDFGIEMPRMLLVLDGCSDAKFSEVGTRLFAQLFSRKEECDNVERFEQNVKEVFEDVIEIMGKYYIPQKDVNKEGTNQENTTNDALEQDFIMENLLFTIIACFKTEDKYIVKLFGDGYIITQNFKGCISYMRFSYGKCPPYYAYKYCSNLKSTVYPNIKDYQFKTFEFDRKTFTMVGIASDGIMPIAKGEVPIIDRLIPNQNELQLEVAIKSKRQSFFDDVTIGIF